MQAGLETATREAQQAGDRAGEFAADRVEGRARLA